MRVREGRLILEKQNKEEYIGHRHSPIKSGKSTIVIWLLTTYDVSLELFDYKAGKRSPLEYRNFIVNLHNLEQFKTIAKSLLNEGKEQKKFILAGKIYMQRDSAVLIVGSSLGVK